MKGKIAGTVMMLTMALGLATAAQASEVKYDYDRSIAFASYKSFAWKAGARAGGDSLALARVENALEEGFAADGYRKLDSPKEADFLIDYRAGARRDLRLREGAFTPGFGRDLRVDSVPVGVLVVDVYDAKSGRLAWRGAVSDALASDPEKADKRTARAVEKLLKKFPPQGK